MPDFFSNDYRYKKNSEVYDLSRFNNNSLSDDFNNTNWNNSGMEIEKTDVTISFNNYLDKVNSPIMSYFPMKKLNKQQQKFLQKPWFTMVIQKCNQERKKLYLK